MTNKALAEWESLGGGIWNGEESTTVKLISEWEPEACDVWLGEPCEGCKNDSPVMIAGQYLDIVTGEWETSESIGGLHIGNWGQEVRSDPSGYLADIMEAAMLDYRGQFRHYAQLARIA